MPNNHRIYSDSFESNDQNVIRWSNLMATGWRTSDLISNEPFTSQFRFVSSADLGVNTPQPPVQQTISENEWPPEKDGEFVQEECELLEKRLEIKAHMLRHQLKMNSKKKRKS